MATCFKLHPLPMILVSNSIIEINGACFSILKARDNTQLPRNDTRAMLLPLANGKYNYMMNPL